MNDQGQFVQQVFAALIAADGIQGDDRHLKSLARRAYRAVAAFEEVRDEQAGGHDIFTVSAIGRP